MDSAMEKKLREMIDRHEIWQVLQRYGRGLDRFDVEMVRSCYFDDAIEDHDKFVGNVDDFIAWANMTSSHYVSHHHGLMNHSCELDGDNAYCETYFLYTGTAATPPHFMATGRYMDHFQRRNGEWRIANRVAIVEGTYDLPGTHFPEVILSSYGPDEAQTTARDRTDVSYHRPPHPRKPHPLRSFRWP